MPRFPKRHLLEHLRLPAEVSPFEAEYLDRANRLAMRWGWLHLPAFILLAWWNGTGPVLAAVLTALVLLGPAVAMSTLENPRHVAITHGVASMGLAGLLVHFGQGPMQIEMHFYIFTLIAGLVLFANPRVIAAATLTVLAHHVLLWALLPASIFNYDASFWVVAVHGGFVLLESSIAVFLARNVFDIIVGFETAVETRTRALDARNVDMQLILDSVGQGFVTLDAQGRMGTERSSVLDEWFETCDTCSFSEWLGRIDPHAGEWFELGWMGVVDGFMPLEVSLAQLPTTMRQGERHFGLEYRRVGGDDDTLERVLVIISDRTDEVARAEAEAAQREVLGIVDAFQTDRSGFLEFFAEAELLVEGLALGEHGDDLTLCRRWLHTLKGNALVYGVKTVADLAHDLEDVVAEERRAPTVKERSRLMERWSSLRCSLDQLLGDSISGRIELAPEELDALLGAVRDGAPRETLLERLQALRLEPAARRLGRIASHAEGFAEQLGKEGVRVEIQDHDVRLGSERFRGFWQAFVHVVRNAVDHGLEHPMEREQLGKSDSGSIRIETRIEADDLLVEVADDGRGIDWDAVRARAIDLGLPTENPGDLVAALFADGFSTAHEVTAWSGRGVGMGALQAAAAELGGSVQVESALGEGTKVRFHFPRPTEGEVPWMHAGALEALGPMAGPAQA